MYINLSFCLPITIDACNIQHAILNKENCLYKLTFYFKIHMFYNASGK